MNLTGSPDDAAKIVYVGNRGSGCSSDQYRQVHTAAVIGPQYSSVGNAVIINDRNGNVIYRSPTDLTIVNSETLPDGSLDPARLTPEDRRIRCATGAQPMRNMQLQIRFGF